MVDIHSHVLYGLDDGADERETSLGMLRMAAEHGSTDIVVSPHANSQFAFQPEEISRQLTEFEAIPGIPRIHRGCDFHLSFDNIETLFRSPSTYTINGLRYLLVEFSDFHIPPFIGGIFQRMLAQGIVPIITHPERNPLLRNNRKQLAEWIRSGCRVQVTGQSLTGRFGKNAESAAKQFLQEGLIHFIASDAHDLKHRPPNLLPAFEFVEKEVGPGIAAALFVTNPTAVINGGDVPESVERVTKPRGWFKLW